MMELLAALKVLILVGLGCAIMVGWKKPGSLMRVLGLWLFLSMTVAILADRIHQAATQGDVAAILLGAGFLAVLLLLGVRFILGRELFSHVLANFIYDILKFLLLLPLRLIRALLSPQRRR